MLAAIQAKPLALLGVNQVQEVSKILILTNHLNHLYHLTAFLKYEGTIINLICFDFLCL